MVKLCSVCNSDFRVLNFNDIPYCNKHYLQMKRHGKILLRTSKDKNDIEFIDGKCAEIILRNKYQKEVARAKIDVNKINIIKDYKWHLTSNGYAASKTFNKITLLHRLVFNESFSKIDHKDTDKLNCTIENLRPCTTSQNAMNTNLSKRNTSGVKGVWFDKRINKWCAEIFVNGCKHFLGRSADINTAIKLRQDAELKYFGEFRFSIKEII